METTQDQKTKITELTKKFQLKLVVVFGSFATGKQRKDSDLDIAVLGMKDVFFKEHVDLINELSAIFNKEVDLTILNKANPLLSFQVSKNPILLYGDRRDLLKFKLNAFKIYHNYAPFFEMERKLNKKIISTYAR
ncbi:MAG: nucleotidyltransferase domain-containing protein [bacterium]|nr:nucleotidyltransferase domain-containing protein [bacterium]